MNAVAALVLIVALAPVWLALAIAIKIESRGPVFYRATRIGRHGKPFAMFKFRKMFDGATGAALTTVDDARFTRIGAFLARTKLDELPQLLNVLTGQMRFVGPRPEDPGFVERHGRMFAPVLTVHPGITGLCQIIYRNESSLFTGDDYEDWYETTLLPHKIYVDRSYALYRSPRLDLRIVLWTLIALVKPVAVTIEHTDRRVMFAVVAQQPEPLPVPTRALEARIEPDPHYFEAHVPS